MKVKIHKKRKYPDMMGSPRKYKTNREKMLNLPILTTPYLITCVAFIMVMIGCGCSSHHYFSINAEEITNPQIEYSDSTRLYNPF